MVRSFDVYALKTIIGLFEEEPTKKKKKKLKKSKRENSKYTCRYFFFELNYKLRNLLEFEE